MVRNNENCSQDVDFAASQSPLSLFIHAVLVMMMVIGKFKID